MFIFLLSQIQFIKLPCRTSAKDTCTVWLLVSTVTCCYLTIWPILSSLTHDHEIPIRLKQLFILGPCRPASICRLLVNVKVDNSDLVGSPLVLIRVHRVHIGLIQTTAEQVLDLQRVAQRPDSTRRA